MLQPQSDSRISHVFQQAVVNVSKYTSPIICRNHDGTIALRGSGVRIEVKDHYFIVTCLHLLKDHLAKKDVRAVEIAEVIPGSGPGLTLDDALFKHGTGKRFPVDLFCAELRRHVIPSPLHPFLPLGRLDPRPGTQHLDRACALMVYGFPEVRAKPNDRGTVVQAYGPLGRVTEHVDALDGPFDETLHIAVGYPDVYDHPRSMSGCGVWHIAAGGADTAPVRCTLIGFQQAISGRSVDLGAEYGEPKLMGRVLRCIRVSCLLRLLADIYPEFESLFNETFHEWGP